MSTCIICNKTFGYDRDLECCLRCLKAKYDAVFSVEQPGFVYDKVRLQFGHPVRTEYKPIKYAVGE